MHDISFPPRGSGMVGVPEAAPSQTWQDPSLLGDDWTWQPGGVLLGSWGDRFLGRNDDRHIATLAGNRAGKSSSALIPNLRRYPGSMIVLDPKGELARACVAYRRALGQRVYILDPFGELGEESASYNPFSEVGLGQKRHIAADTAQTVDALIINNPRDTHWTDSGKNLSRGLLLNIMATRPQAVTLRELRRQLSSTPPELERLFREMTDSSAFDGIVANIGAAFLGKHAAGGRELQSILSTVQEQTASFDDVVHISDRSDFRLADLNSGQMSIFLVLPGMRMGTHFRWLRLMIQQALAVLERAPVRRGALPVWFVLEEFPSLGHMRSIETAAGLMAGFGVKLWSVLQDLTQLKTHYPNSWETFLGNAGVIQAFGNFDLTTTEHLSKMLGQTQVLEVQNIRVSGAQMGHGDSGRREHIRHVRLLDPNEITQHFARETFRQLVIVPGSPPVYMDRLAPEGRERA
ncbi:type IV secretory system conjugative DNA transfer family protein [Bradyrhizobium liaoningense]